MSVIETSTTNTTVIPSVEVKEPIAEDYSNIELGELPVLKEGESYKGLAPLSELSKVHKDIPKHIKNLQGAKTKAEQRAASLEKELGELRSKYEKDTKSAVSVVKTLKPTTTVNPKDYDLHTEEGFEAYQMALAEYRVSQTLHQMYSPIQEQHLAQEKEKANQEIDTFLNSHDEFEDDAFLEDVVAKMETKGLTINEAYILAMHSYKPATKIEDVITKSNKAIDKRNDLLTIGNPGKHTKTKITIESKDPWDVYEAYKKAGRLDELIRPIDRK